ncbi:MAG TPA: hypothetical protein P5560_05800 [Thermotogota bacterium]|nr:hypothetical protein [Thermotogota bacterium]HRW92452.1 hypothetical protein [Thermotogota bacterium]
MEKLAKLFFILTLLFAASFIAFFLLYFRAQNEISTSRIELVNLRQQSSTAAQTINSLRVQNEELQRRVDFLQEQSPGGEGVDAGQLEELQAEVSRLQEELEKSQAQVAVLSGSSTSSSVAVSAREQALMDDLAKMKETYEIELEKYANLVSEKDSQIQQLTDQVRSATTTAVVAPLPTSGATLTESLQKELAQANALLSKKDDTIRQLEAQLKSLGEQLALLQDSSTALSELQKQLEDSQRSEEVLQDQLQELQSQVKNLQVSVDQKVAQVESLEKRLNAERSSLPIPPGEEDALQYKKLLLGEDRLLAQDYLQSAQYFLEANLDALPLGDLATVYQRKRDLAFRHAIAQGYETGYKAYKAEEYSTAISAFLGALEYCAYVTSDFADDSSYYLAQSYLAMGRTTEARAEFESLLSREGSSFVVHAKYYLLKMALERGDTSSARALANELAQGGTYQSYAKSVLQQLGQ